MVSCRPCHPHHLEGHGKAVTYLCLLASCWWRHSPAQPGSPLQHPHRHHQRHCTCDTAPGLFPWASLNGAHWTLALQLAATSSRHHQSRSTADCTHCVAVHRASTATQWVQSGHAACQSLTPMQGAQMCAACWSAVHEVKAAGNLPAVLVATLQLSWCSANATQHACGLT